MTSRERVLLALNRQKPDRLPFNFWMDRDRMAQLDEELGENFRVSHYGADVIETFPNLPFFLQLRDETERYFDGKTTWVTHRPEQGILDLLEMGLPDPQEESCYDGIREDRRRYPDKALFAMMNSPLETIFGRLGLEKMFYELADYPDETALLCERISEIMLQAIDHIAACDVDVLYLAGDVCMTRGAMLSQEMLSRFLFAPMQKLIDRAHELGLKVFYHTDGYVLDILPLFVQAKLDGINPLQYSVGNDPVVFARDYGDKLMVYGAMDNCAIIPDGTADEVRAHVRYLFETLGKNGGYIASSHDIPGYAPQENVEAMVAEIKACCYE